MWGHKCQSRQIARCELRKEGLAQWQKTIPLPWTRGLLGKEKQESPDWQETKHFVMTSIWEKAKNDGKRWESWTSECNLLLFFFLHYDKISLVVRSPHHALTPLPCWSRLNKGKNPSSSCEGRARMKIMEYNPKRLPLKWIFHPFIFMTGIVNLPQKLRTTVHLSLPTLPLREYNRLLSTSPYPTMACL